MNQENKLGEGNYGDVYKIKYKKTRITYAAKFIKGHADFLAP